MCRPRWKKKELQEPENHALGRSRGGLSTKIHFLCDSRGNLLHHCLSSGQAHEAAFFEELLCGADRAMVMEDGHPVAWPVALAGDKGYHADWIDEYLLGLGIIPIIPPKSNEHSEKRAVDFDKEKYWERNIIERLIGWLKECRRIFSRFEKTATNFSGMIKMASIERYLNVQTK